MQSNNANGFTPEANAVLAKVRKLLNLANNEAATEGERNNAMRMAQNLLAKHNLSVSQVAESAVQRIKDAFDSTEEWEWLVAQGVSKLFFCKVYRSMGHPITVKTRRGTKTVKGYAYNFIGRTENVITGIEISRWVIASIRKEADKRFSGSKIDAILGNAVDQTEADREGFISGASLAVFNKCQELFAASQSNPLEAASSGTELVPASYYQQENEANAVVLERLGIRLVPGRAVNLRGGAGYEAGVNYGKSINLNRQVGSSAGGPKLLK